MEVNLWSNQQGSVNEYQKSCLIDVLIMCIDFLCQDSLYFTQTCTVAVTANQIVYLQELQKYCLTCTNGYQGHSMLS